MQEYSLMEKSNIHSKTKKLIIPKSKSKKILIKHKFLRSKKAFKHLNKHTIPKPAIFKTQNHIKQLVSIIQFLLLLPPNILINCSLIYVL